jgi:hydrogenase nickel incorporation protein HypA/HybF
MHEYSIVSSLLARVEQEARVRHATAVHRLRLGIGELSGVEIELLTTAYETFRERTVCDRAALEIQRIEARWSCPKCGREITRGEPLRCDGCGVPARLTQGDELVLQRIEMEVPDV